MALGRGTDSRRRSDLSDTGVDEAGRGLNAARPVERRAAWAGPGRAWAGPGRGGAGLAPGSTGAPTSSGAGGRAEVRQLLSASGPATAACRFTVPCASARHLPRPRPDRPPASLSAVQGARPRGSGLEPLSAGRPADARGRRPRRARG